MKTYMRAILRDGIERLFTGKEIDTVLAAIRHNEPVTIIEIYQEVIV